MEKYRTWSDCHGDVESRFTKDELLTTITLYWVTQTINSSTRLYYETLRQPWTLQQGERIVVPQPWRPSQRRSAGRPGSGASAPSMSNVGPRCLAAAISLRSRSLNCWPMTFAPSFAL